MKKCKNEQHNEALKKIAEFCSKHGVKLEYCPFCGERLTEGGKDGK